MIHIIPERVIYPTARANGQTRGGNTAERLGREIQNAVFARKIGQWVFLDRACMVINYSYLNLTQDARNTYEWAQRTYVRTHFDLNKGGCIEQCECFDHFGTAIRTDTPCTLNLHTLKAKHYALERYKNQTWGILLNSHRYLTYAEILNTDAPDTLYRCLIQILQILYIDALRRCWTVTLLSTGYQALILNTGFNTEKDFKH